MNTSVLARPEASQVSSQTYDVIVIGGGITGAGIAQDAAARGMRTLLLEKGDFASGTSSKSTKLIHGGLRYLQSLQFAVTLESVRERQRQQKLAPHLVHAVPFVIPLYRGQNLKNLKVSIGLWIYDLMAGFAGNRFHKRIATAEVLRRCPGIRREGLVGGLLYYDCRTDDARHTLEVVKSAREHGAEALNYARVVALVKQGGRVVGVDYVDEMSDPQGQSPVRARARVVVNATGVWTQKTEELSGGGSGTEVVPAKGIHVTVSRARLPIDCAMIVPSVHDKRFCFAVPWYDAVVIGTTDTEYHGDLEEIKVEDGEVAYVLDAVNAMFPEAGLTEADLTGRFAGLRPLIRQAGARSTADLSRQHVLHETADGLISIAGGKLTTYRPMAAETVDLVARRLSQAGSGFSACRTDRIMLGGWQSGDDIDHLIERFQEEARELGLPRETALYLPAVYGKRTQAILELVRGDRALAATVAPGHPYIFAQVVYAVEYEAARTISDVIARRIRLSITDAQAADAAADAVSKVMAARLAWTADERAAQLRRFRQELRS